MTVFEVRLGLRLLDKGRRRGQLEQAFDNLIRLDLQDRVQVFDVAAAAAAADIAARQRRAGRAVEMRDVQIAGIACARRATLATGNARHFSDTGISVVDPWQHRG